MEIINLPANLLVSKNKTDLLGPQLVNDGCYLLILLDDQVRLVNVDIGWLFHMVREKLPSTLLTTTSPVKMRVLSIQSPVTGKIQEPDG